MLKNTSCEWLDLKSLFEKLFNQEDHTIVKIKYYTAHISGHSSNDESPLRQKYHLQAIHKYISEIEIYYGHYLTHPIRARLVNPEPGKPPFTHVYKTEEKVLMLT